MYGFLKKSSASSDAVLPTETPKFTNSFFLWLEGTFQYTPVEGEPPKITKRKIMTQLFRDLALTLNTKLRIKGEYQFDVIGKMEGLGLLWTNCSKSEMLAHLDDFFKEQSTKGIHLSLKDKEEFREALPKSRLFKKYQRDKIKNQARDYDDGDEKEIRESRAIVSAVPRPLAGTFLDGYKVSFGSFGSDLLHTHTNTSLYVLDTHSNYSSFGVMYVKGYGPTVDTMLGPMPHSNYSSLDAMYVKGYGPTVDMMLGPMPLYPVSTSDAQTFIKGVTLPGINCGSIYSGASFSSVEFGHTGENSLNNNTICVDPEPTFGSGYAYPYPYGGVWGSAAPLSLSSDYTPTIVVCPDSAAPAPTLMVSHGSIEAYESETHSTTGEASSALSPSTGFISSLAGAFAAATASFARFVGQNTATNSSISSASGSAAPTHSTTPSSLLSQFYSAMQQPLYSLAGIRPVSSNSSSLRPKEKSKSSNSM